MWAGRPRLQRRSLEGGATGAALVGGVSSSRGGSRPVGRRLGPPGRRTWDRGGGGAAQTKGCCGTRWGLPSCRPAPARSARPRARRWRRGAGPRTGPLRVRRGAGRARAGRWTAPIARAVRGGASAGRGAGRRSSGLHPARVRKASASRALPPVGRLLRGRRHRHRRPRPRPAHAPPAPARGQARAPRLAASPASGPPGLRASRRPGLPARPRSMQQQHPRRRRRRRL